MAFASVRPRNTMITKSAGSVAAKKVAASSYLQATSSEHPEHVAVSELRSWGKLGEGFINKDETREVWRLCLADQAFSHVTKVKP